MDNLTHSLTGLMLARAGLGKTTERGGTLMLVLAANAPDLDGLTLFGGRGMYLTYHRSYPHALALLPVMALLSLVLAHWIRGAAVTWKTWLACCIGVLSHLALDFSMVYGVRLFLPFSSRMPHMDITGLIDPWFFLVFAIAVAAPWLAGLVNSEIRGSRAAGPKRAWAIFALVTLCGYDGFRYAAHQRALALMGSRIYEGGPAQRIAAFPASSNPLEWRGVVETGSAVLNIPIHLDQEFDPGQAEVDYPAPDSPAVEAARASPQLQPFLRFNQLPFWKVTPVDSGTRVDLIDMRFASPRRGGFADSSVVVGPDGRVRGGPGGR